MALHGLPHPMGRPFLGAKDAWGSVPADGMGVDISKLLVACQQLQDGQRCTKATHLNLRRVIHRHWSYDFVVKSTYILFVPAQDLLQIVSLFWGWEWLRDKPVITAKVRA